MPVFKQIKNQALLLCDEPTGAMDYHTWKEILELIERINQTYHNTIIMVTYNEAIKHMAHRVLKLHEDKSSWIMPMKPSYQLKN